MPYVCQAAASRCSALARGGTALRAVCHHEGDKEKATVFPKEHAAWGAAVSSDGGGVGGEEKLSKITAKLAGWQARTSAEAVVILVTIC